MGDLTTLRLRCLECGVGRVRVEADGARCAACGETYPLFHGRPVMLPREGALFTRADYEAQAAGPPPTVAPQRRTRWLPNPSANLSSDRLLARFGADLAADLAMSGPVDVLVVGGGAQRADLERRFAGRPGIRLWVTDIDVRADADVLCDAHDLPFEDGSFGGVLATAVLEHVADPERVAHEIARVARPGALIYSELPFMQQVHEGAYDFTRFSHGGHLRLWRAFDEIESGVVAGPGTALAWSLEHFAAALAPIPALIRPARGVARLTGFWLKYFDHAFGNSPAAIDGAGCTYFYGRRRAEGEVSDREIVARYAGARSLRHV